MEEIKTSIEKIFDQFSDSLVYGNPKRLSYNFTPESGIPDTQVAVMNVSVWFKFFLVAIAASKKRKLSPNQSQTQNNASTNSIADDSHNTTSESLNASLPASAWEVRRLKADIIDYNTKVECKQLREYELLERACLFICVQIVD